MFLNTSYFVLLFVRFSVSTCWRFQVLSPMSTFNGIVSEFPEIRSEFGPWIWIMERLINTSWLLPSKCRCSTTPSLLPEPRPQRPSRRTRESALSIVRTQVHSIDWADEGEKCVLLSGDSRNSSAPWEIPVQNQLWERRSGSQTTNI